MENKGFSSILGLDIMEKATVAMIEAGVRQEKVIEMLQKHWERKR